ncbi:uncharacterized protein [Phaseolus vulgaris]|uniref:uncharacterized protein n=1 Tax=Phaseolus vulgaris TaxID=3885 RepID=UPI0035CB4DAA
MGNRVRYSRKGDHGYSNDYTTFFFSNFPHGYGEMDMVKVFQRQARVKEVFISCRLNRLGRRFGFVRFFEVRNMGRLEKELDSLYIGNMKLYVNIPKYRRHQLEPVKEERRDSRLPYTERQRDTGKRKEIWVEKKGKKYFVEAVKGEAQQVKWKGLVIKTQLHILPWMEKSVVGKLKDGMNFDQLGEEFLKGGLNRIRVRFLGDNLALVTPREGENMRDIIKLNKQWFDSFFTSIKPWSVSSVADHKIVWVRCYGLPFSYWNKDCFVKVLGESATLVSIDTSTLLLENLEYARLQVRSRYSCNTRLVKSIEINIHTCSILIEE